MPEHRCPECGRPFNPLDPTTFVTPKAPTSHIGLKVLLAEVLIYGLIVLVVWRGNPTLGLLASALLSFFYWLFVCILLLSGYCVVTRLMRSAAKDVKEA